MSVGTPEINYTPVTLSISQRGSAAGNWKEAGIIISENSTLNNPRNAGTVLPGSVTGTIRKDYKKVPIDTSTDTYKIPFWTTAVNTSAFSSITTQTTNWPYIDGINPSGTNFIPNTYNDPSGGLKPLTMYYANWYVKDSNNDYYVGSSPQSFKTKKALKYIQTGLYIDPGKTTPTNVAGQTMPNVCCPDYNNILDNQSLLTDDPSLDNSDKVVKDVTINSSGTTQVIPDPNSTYFRTATGSGYYKWDGIAGILSSGGICSACPGTTATPNGNTLTAVGKPIKTQYASVYGLYQPCTVWNGNISDQANLDKIGNDGWGKARNGTWDSACIWVKLKDTDTQAYPVGTVLTVEDPNNTSNTLTVKVGVPNIDESGNYSSSGGNTPTSVKKRATKLVPLIDEKSSMAMQFVPRNFGTEYKKGQFASGPIDEMKKISDKQNRKEWTPQYLLNQTMWDIAIAPRTQNATSRYFKRTARGPRQKFGAGDTDYDLWDYMEEFSWYVVNDSSVLTNPSNVYNDDVSKNQIWIGVGDKTSSSPWTTSPNKQGDYNLRQVDTLGSTGNYMKSGNQYVYNATQTQNMVNSWAIVEHGKSWFYKHRPSGVISTFRRPYFVSASAISGGGDWHFPDSPKLWDEDNYAAATEVLNQPNFNEARHVQLAMNSSVSRVGSMQAQFRQWGPSWVGHWGDIMHSGSVFSSLYGAGFLPTGLTGTLTNSGWSNGGANGTQLNNVLFNVPENAGPLYLAKFTQTKDGYPARKVFNRGNFGGYGDTKFWQGNAFWDHQNKFWFTVAKNVWSSYELTENQMGSGAGTGKLVTPYLEATFKNQSIKWREKS